MDLFVLILVGTIILNCIDLITTNKLVDKLGPAAEANPLARWMYTRWGKCGIIVVKILLVILYVTAMGWSWFIGDISSTFNIANVIIFGIYAYTVGRGTTLLAMISDA